MLIKYFLKNLPYLYCLLTLLERVIRHGTMKKEEFIYPKNDESSTVTGTPGADFQQGKMPPVKFNKNFYLI